VYFFTNLIAAKRTDVSRLNSQEEIQDQRHPTSVSHHAQRPPTKVHQTLGPSLNLFSLLRHLAHPSLIFTGVKSPKFGSDFRPRSHFELPTFIYVAAISNVKQILGSAIIPLNLK